MPESSEATITLAGDLHARPAGALSVAAAKIVGTSQANAKSVLAVMQLGASSGQQVTIRATGPDAGAAVAAIIGILAGATKAGD